MYLITVVYGRMEIREQNIEGRACPAEVTYKHRRESRFESTEYIFQHSVSLKSFNGSITNIRTAYPIPKPEYQQTVYLRCRPKAPACADRCRTNLRASLQVCLTSTYLFPKLYSPHSSDSFVSLPRLPEMDRRYIVASKPSAVARLSSDRGLHF